MTVPENPEAERHLLGSVLLGGEGMREAAPVVRAEDFYNVTHQNAFAACLRLWERGESPTVPAVAEQMRRDGTWHSEQLGPVLLSMTASAATYRSAKWAEAVAEWSARRRLHALATQIALDCLDPAVDVVDTLMHARMEVAQVSVPSLAQVLDVYPAEEFIRLSSAIPEWVVPGVLGVGDRLIVVAPEGFGKSTLLRQLAALTAQGVHPFTTSGIEPQRTLLVDLENPGNVLRQRLAAIPVNMGLRGYENGLFWVWHRPGGIDLRSRAGAAELDEVCRRTKPRLVCLGPLYKAFRQDGAKSDQVAGEVAFLLDDLRTRHGFALVLEHHAPMQQSGEAVRRLRPFGSGVWSQWPEFGMKLIPEDEKGHTLKVGWFRPGRDERTWPTQFKRGTTKAWDPVYE